jgi:ssDNA thymidine ADP-ribosyltransferase, DarT
MIELFDKPVPKDVAIYRMVHYANLPFVIDHGLHCSHCEPTNPNYVPIGQPNIVSKRKDKRIDFPPGGILSDYVPFYFHYRMPMLHNISTGKVKGFNGSQEDIIYLATRPNKVQDMGVDFIFTDRHAGLAVASGFSSLDDLSQLSWRSMGETYIKCSYVYINHEFRRLHFFRT